MTEIAEVKSRLSTVYVFGRKKQMSGLQRKEINQMRKWNKRLLSGCLLAALLMMGLGLWRGEGGTVLSKGINLCMECVGIG